MIFHSKNTYKERIAQIERMIREKSPHTSVPLDKGANASSEELRQENARLRAQLADLRGIIDLLAVHVREARDIFTVP